MMNSILVYKATNQ